MTHDALLRFIKHEGAIRGCNGLNAYAMRVGGAQQLKGRLDSHPAAALLQDAGGWSSKSMPLYYGGHSIEGSRHIAELMVEPVTHLPK